MTEYCYREAMINDIKNYIDENGIEITEDNRDEMQEKLYDDLWIEDSVTGNGSGSYTFSAYDAKMHIFTSSDGYDALTEAVQEFCIDAETIAEKFINQEWEWLDVTIRCYLLSETLSMAIDDILNARALPF